MSIPYAVTEELDRYLDDADRMTLGTGTSLPAIPEPLPSLGRGVPLYDVTDDWIEHHLGGRDNTPPDGVWLWDKVLIASRRQPDNAKAALKAWALWLRELNARQWAAKATPGVQAPAIPAETTALADFIEKCGPKRRVLLRFLYGDGRLTERKVAEATRRVYGEDNADNRRRLIELKKEANGPLAKCDPQYEISIKGETIALRKIDGETSGVE